jgi:cytochrome c-type biogenesis protein
MNTVSIFSAFSAGLVSFFSPCVFPLIGIYISMITGFTIQDLQSDKLNLALYKKQIILRTLFFVLGFSFVFILLGIFAKYISLYVFQNKKILKIIIAFIMIIFSLYMLDIFKLLKLDFLQRFFSNEKRFNIVDYSKNDKKDNCLNKSFIKKLIFNFVFGIFFGLGWTPCIGPILGSILMMASIQETVIQSSYLLAVYSLGLIIPFFLVSIFYNVLFIRIKTLNKYLFVFQKIMGIFLLIIGILILNGKIF